MSATIQRPIIVQRRVAQIRIALPVAKWRSCKLGDALTLKRGHDLPNQVRRKGSVPVVSSAGITGYHDKAAAKAPGVVTGRYGTIGEVFYLDQDYWPLNTALYVIDFKGTNPKFASYFLRNALDGYQSDKAAVPGIDRNVLHELTVRVPDISTQQAIASILSAYDDLIENNRRRMALLEESARVLYREWFVHLRFPGHTRNRVTDGVPKGWKRQTLGEHLVLNYGKALKAEDRVDGDIPVYGSSGIIGTHDKALSEGPGIILGRKGNVGSVYWSPTAFYAIDTVYFIAPDKSDLYLFHALKHMHFINTDVAVPGLNRDMAYSRPLLLPSKTVQQNFLEVVNPVYEQIIKLNQLNQKLRAARDLLLPRLMSGEIAP
jgi:type I restriction enzyme, S subunit